MKKWEDKNLLEKCLSWIFNTLPIPFVFSVSVLAWVMTGCQTGHLLYRQDRAKPKFRQYLMVLRILWFMCRSVAAYEMGKYVTFDEYFKVLERRVEDKSRNPRNTER